MDHRPWATNTIVVSCLWSEYEEEIMPYKFEQLDVWRLSVEYIDLIYEIADRLPKSEEYNLKSQIKRTATSVALNIAEGSTGQSNPEQVRFLSMAVRSLIETVACQHIIRRRNYFDDLSLLDRAYQESNQLARKLQAFRNSIKSRSNSIREESVEYLLS
jgi:four helix bundle protein